MADKSFFDQVGYLENIKRESNSLHGKNSFQGSLRAIAFSLLVMKAAVQFHISENHAHDLFDFVIPKLSDKFDEYYIDLRFEKELKPYGVKLEHGQGMKTNIYFSDVYSRAKSVSPRIAAEFGRLSYFTRGFTNDQATSAICFSLACEKFFGARVVEMAIRLINFPAESKNLTIILKSSGMNSRPIFSVLTESHCLQGMSVDDGSLEEAVSDRIDESLIESKTIKFFENDLREAISDILDSEMDMRKYEFEDPDSFWERRWGWFVNGSHTKNLENHESEWKIWDPGKKHERVYRRCVSENVPFNPITNFSGKVYVGSSFKKEIGKSGRTICSCDTQCYTAFAHLLDGVEKSWRGDRILLCPGKDGSYLMSERVRSLGEGVSVMADYEEFDKQHRLEAQQLLIDTLCRKINYPAEMREKLVRSFKMMLLHCEGKTLGYIKYSLVSGHRATTFINSVLNAAYLRMCLGREKWRRIKSLHTGDDIVAVFPGFEIISDLLTDMKRYNIRMNPMKQSIGMISREFLRISVSVSHSNGYFCRSLGRAISGNWEVEKVMDKMESLAAWISTSRTLINRSFNSEIYKLFDVSMGKSTGLKRKICRRLLQGSLALGHGPVYQSHGQWEGIKITERINEKRFEQKFDKILADYGYKDLATRSYLENRASDVEKRVFATLGLSPKKYMLEASYAKNESVRNLTMNLVGIRTSRIMIRPVRGYMLVSEAFSFRRKRKKTLFDVYPLLNFIHDKIPKGMIYHLCAFAGLDPLDTLMEINEINNGGNYIDGFINFSDASSLPVMGWGSRIHILKPDFS